MYRQLGDVTPDVDDALLLKGFFEATQKLITEKSLLAYHDRSDGGLFVTVAEMAFAGNCGVSVELDALGDDDLSALYNEELGAVIQVRADDVDRVVEAYAKAGLTDCVHVIGQPMTNEDAVRFTRAGEVVLEDLRSTYRTIWAETTFQMQSLRDNPAGAEAEFTAKQKLDDPGLHAELTFDPSEDVAAPYINTGRDPVVAILREQGVNSHVEMAAAFDRAGFAAVDVHMSDILSGRIQLDKFHGLVACGGFSYGDVLGAGEGWAKSILFNSRARDQFSAFFERDKTFALGVCNGCQMLSSLKELIPGTEHWPRFVTNKSERFEARFSMVEVQESKSLFLTDMAGSRMPIAVSHGEGLAEFKGENLKLAEQQGLVAMRFIDNWGKVTENYPANPNGSPAGITGLTNSDGRVTIMMPHPERVFRTVSNSWHPDGWGEDSAWMRMFRNARVHIA